MSRIEAGHRTSTIERTATRRPGGSQPRGHQPGSRPARPARAARARGRQVPSRRVRDEVKDGVAVAAASVAASVVVVLVATLLMKLAG